MPVSQRTEHPIYYEVHGQGVPVLMITGMASVMDWFYFNIPGFVEAGYQVVAQDLRGSNRPGIGPAPGRYSTADMAGDSLGVLDEVGIESAHIVGLSMGGMIAQHLAISCPNRVRKVSIVANGLARTPKEVADGALSQIEAGPDGHPRTIQDLTEQELLETILTLSFTPAFRDREPERFAFFVEMRQRHGALPESQAAQTIAAVEHDTLDDLGRISAPVQLLVGELDQINGGRAAEMAERIPNCEFRVLAGMSHGLNLEHADEYNELVLEFLAR